MNFRKFGAIAAFLLAISNIAHADMEYPQSPVRMIVPYAAGGGMDIVARTIAKSMGGSLKQPVVVVNAPGAGTTIGATQAARSKPDGYTILWGDSATFTFNKFLYKELPYDPEASFSPISLTMSGAVTLAVSESMGVRSVPELLARFRADPGKYQYASAGQGSPHHLAMEELKLAAGLELTHIPYRGESPALIDLMSGIVPVMFLGDTMARRGVDSGKVRLLATAGSKRNPLFPDVPTLAEAGVPGFESIFWHALVAPAGTSSNVIRSLQQAYATAMKDPTVVSFLATNNPGLTFRVSTPEEAGAYMKEQLRKASAFMPRLKIEKN